MCCCAGKFVSFLVNMRLRCPEGCLTCMFDLSRTLRSFARQRIPLPFASSFRVSPPTPICPSCCTRMWSMTEQPTTEQPTTEQPTTEQPTTEQPTTEQPTT
ncbi:hypothetical protein Vafri_4898, partial [Volvox africanus]